MPDLNGAAESSLSTGSGRPESQVPVAAKSSLSTGTGLPDTQAPVVQVPIAAPPFKYKYKEAIPLPEGAEASMWNKCYTAADSRLYNNYGKKAERSQKARASGETRKLALKLLEERIAKAAQSTFASSTTNTRTQTSPTIPATNSSTLHNTNPLSNPPFPTATVSAENTQPSSLQVHLQKSTPVKMERSSSGNKTTPFVFGAASSDAASAKFTFTENPPTIADSVKGKGRPAKKQALKLTSASMSTPRPGFGPGSLGYAEKRKRDDPEDEQRSAPTVEYMNEWVDRKMESMSFEELTELNAGVDEMIKRRQAAEAEPFVNPVAEAKPFDNPVAPSSGKPTKSKKRREARKRAVANKIAELTQQSPRSPVESEDDSDDGREYCVCRGPDDHRRMIACDACDEWFHCSCVSVEDDDVDLIDKYICYLCAEKGKHTTWKPMCRLKGCRKPCNLAANPPSKYCSDEHRKRWAQEQVAKMPDGLGPSRGGAITKGELKAMLDATKSAAAFHKLGKKPALPEGSMAINVEDFMTKEQKDRLARIAVTRQNHQAAIDGYTEKGKLIRMATARMRKEMDKGKDSVGICGWDPLLSMNEEEFAEWRDSEEGKRAFESGLLEGSFCDRKHCKKHPTWIKTVSLDINEEVARLKKMLEKLRVDEQTIHDRCKVKAAIQMQ